ncbi:MFS transporter [Propionibacteriaceae bacterium G1746]|uniref:MFS transporter n=1 Tax=Aestuariimicrobium sp. G57 TaxID=3418485 RepID=UPI003C1809B3
MTEQPPPATAPPAAAPATSPTTAPRRPVEARMRTFWSILVNTGLANLTTSFLWFALVFWIYLETRDVRATGIVGGGYMLLMSVTAISFGTLVDRFRKLDIMRFAGLFTLACFVLAAGVFFMAPAASRIRMDQPWLWVFAALILVGAIVENMRNIALSTTVTILVDAESRDKANGMVGAVQGLAFMVTSVLSGLAVGQLGMGGTLVIALVLTAAVWVHLLTLHMPEEVEPAASDAQGHFDLMGSWLAVRAIPGLLALLLFSTFNNFIGGVYMALLDPYGLEMFSVEVWGVVYAIAGTGFIVGGAIIGRTGLGKNPLRTMLFALMLMAAVGALFTIREWALLFIIGIWVYMALSPAVEAAEQTVIQRVVPLEKQGRVFGFAAAVETSAAPVTAFLIAPIAEVWIFPWTRSDAGAAAIRPLLGDGQARGIALIFLVSGVIMGLAALAALFSPIYRRVSRTYAQASDAATPESDDQGAAAEPVATHETYRNAPPPWNVDRD